jgi:hypothetical protein
VHLPRNEDREGGDNRNDQPDGICIGFPHNARSLAMR